MIVRPKYRGPDLPTTLAVAMTAGAATGVDVAHSTEYDLGSTSFTLPINIDLPDYTPSADQWLYYKYQDASNYWGLRVKTSGVLNFIAVTGGVTRLDIDSTSSVSVTNGLKLWGAISVTRESASVAGSALFTINGAALGATVAITAGAPTSLSNTGSLYIAGTNAAGTESTLRSAYPYNRALSAAEVLDLCNNGVAAADVGASQTAVYAGNYSSGVDGVTTTSGTTLTGNIDSIAGENDWLRVQRTGASGNNFCLLPVSGLIGKRVRTSIKIHNAAGSGVSYFYISYVNSPPSATQQVIVAIAEGTTQTIGLDAVLSRATTIAVAPSTVSGNNVNVATGSIYYVRESFIYKSGCTLQLDPTGLTASGLTWTDSSGNGNNGTLPAAGATKVTIRK